MEATIIEHNTIKRHLSAEQKLAIVKASYAAGVSVGEIARKYGVGLSSLIKWRKYATEGSLQSMKDNAPTVSASELKKLKKENQQLQKLLGKRLCKLNCCKKLWR